MITCCDAVESDMKAVARLHEACFRGTFIASLGEALIADYYREFLQEGGPFVLAFEDEKLVGLCMGYYAGSGARNAFVSKNKGRLARRLLALCLSLNKVAIKKCFGYVFSRKKAASAPRAEADLLSICVLDEYRGKKVSRRLLEEFEQRVSAAGKKDVTLSVYKSNGRAIAFYKKMGYSVCEKGIDEYKMYKSLSE